MSQEYASRQQSLFGDRDGCRHPEVVLTLRNPSAEDGRQGVITYGHAHTKFGLLTMVTVDECILHAHLGDSEAEGKSSLRRHFPLSELMLSELSVLSDLVRYFDDPAGIVPSFRLAVTGTSFQLEVWRALLTIPFGERVSYAQLAARVGRPETVRAVGTAVGRNPVAFLIPCHRVVQSGGGLGGYMWGVGRKRVMLGWEAGVKAAVD